MSDTIITQGFGSDDLITQGFGGGGSDTTPPTAPEISGAAVVVATVTITLTLVTGTDTDDDDTVLTYNIYRDGDLIEAGVSGPTWSETQPADDSTHDYTVSMSDPTGNEGEQSEAESVTWSAPSSGSVGSGGSYPVYICVPLSIDSPLTFRQHDVGQPFVRQLVYQNGAPVNLTGKTVRMKMQPIAGGALKINALATILCASLGIVSYTFVGDDTDTAGSFNVTFAITNSDASPRVFTAPSDSNLRIKIKASE